MTKDFIQERLYLKGVSLRTVDWYRFSFKAFNGALESKQTIIKRISELKEGGASNITINSYLRAVNAYFMWLHKEQGRELIKLPRLKEEQRILQTLIPANVSSILSYKPVGVNLRRAHAIALAILDTGLRASEVLGLTKEDINMDTLVFKVLGKGGKHRLVPFSFELRRSLYKFVSSRGTSLFIFGTNKNTKVTVHNLDRDFNNLAKHVGIGHLNPHLLRHSFAVMYLRNGGNLEYLRRILGHSSLSTTQKYLRSLGVEDLGDVHDQLSPLSARR